MGDSLQEQLLKAGLIDQGRLDQVRKDKKKTSSQQRGKRKKAAPAVRPQPTQEQLEKAARDRELNEQRNRVRHEREVAAEVRQLVRQHRHPRSEHEDDQPFHFENKGKIKRIFVSAQTHRLIADRQLVIVNDNGVFELVAPPIAEKIRQRNPSLVIDLPDEQQPAEDDPYAQYQVPDDLMW
ncbi:MAG: DUF2058 domain-containing protein [Chromatiaceae bacterium]|nr:DUF2058 domain-containing protein [Chromatiaceae bacterium]